jgi:hypothetical protein
MGRTSPRLDWLAVWILWSAWCSLSGWTLSAFGHLDRVGFAITTLLFAGLVIAGRRFLAPPSARLAWLWRRSTYARHLLPKIWATGAILVVIGGLIYSPSDYDYLSYRLPRLLHWWWAHRWHWIDTSDDRQNISAVGMEWLMAPLFVFFRTDRLFFLINVISFLFLPGLIFSVFHRMGVGRRMSWNWMWLLPFGYCFILQAGSTANDTFAAVPFLASLYYALRAGPGAPLAAALSIISLALVTGDKASNIPLGLPWLAVVWLNGRGFFGSTRLVLLGAAAAIGLAASFVPIGLVNTLHTGSYSGDPANVEMLMVKSPGAGVAGNALEIFTGAIAPPVWPHALDIHFLSRSAVAELKRDYPRYAPNTVPVQLEDNAGIGAGVTLMVAAAIVAGIAARFRGAAPPLARGTGLFALATALAFGGYMAKMGSEAAARLVAVYYVAGLLALLLLLPHNRAWTRHPLWRALAVLVMAAVLPLLVLNPARPLLPRALIVRALILADVPPSSVAQLESNYQLRFARLDLFRAIRLALPASLRSLDVIEDIDDPETGFWLPLGSREVVRPHPEKLGSLTGHFVAVNPYKLEKDDHLTLEQLMKQNSLRIVLRQDVTPRTNVPVTFYLLAPADPAMADPEAAAR